MMLNLIKSFCKDDSNEVVVIEKGRNSIFEIPHHVRLINSEEYNILSYDELYGFISGVLASNYDITHICIDSIFKMCGCDFEKLANFIIKLNKKYDNSNIDFVLSLSCGLDKLKSEFKKYEDNNFIKAILNAE